jgi:homoserine acetyltransferase
MAIASSAAKAFLKSVDKVFGLLVNDVDANSTIWITGSPETAELRRRSMDLTRALAELRKPN